MAKVDPVQCAMLEHEIYVLLSRAIEPVAKELAEKWCANVAEVERDADPGAADFLTTEEVAALVRTSPETVRYWRHADKGPKSFKVGRRVLYAREDVEAFVTEARRGRRDAE